MISLKKGSRLLTLSHLSASLCLLSQLQAEEKRSLELQWENDSFLDPFTSDFTDRHYTQGLVFRYWNHDDIGGKGFLWSASLMNFVWNFGMDIEATRGGLALGQEIYTPENIAFGPPSLGVGFSLDAFDLQSDDRPYAGYLYIEPQWERRGRVAFLGLDSLPARDRFGIALGIVGPSSGAEFAQTRWHEIFNGVEPVGWDNQLDNEFAFTLHAERTWLFQHTLSRSPLSIDFLPTVAFDLGNVSTRFTAGLETRFGFGDIHPFELSSLRGSESDYGVYFFASAEGWAVARNIFLDGNTFADSHSVRKEHLVGELSLGMGFSTSVLEGRVAWVRRSSEFELQDEANSYLSFSAKILF